MRFKHSTLSTVPFLLAMVIGLAGMGTSVYDIHARQVGALDVGHGHQTAVGDLVAEQPTVLTRFLERMRFMATAEDGFIAAELLTPVSGLKALKQRASDIVKSMEKTQEQLADASMTEEARKAANADLDKLIEMGNENKAAIEREEKVASFRRTIEPVPDPDEEAGRRAAQHVSVHDRAEDDRTGGFRSVADFARAVRSAFTPGGKVDARFSRGIYAVPTNYHETGGTAGEGYMVPAQHREEIFQLAFPGNDLISRLAPEPTDSNAVDIEGDETTPWGASGVQAKWRSEASQMTATKTETKLRTVRLQELYAFVLASDELLSDAPRLQNRITVKSAEAIRYKACDAVMNGDGAGKPLGWMKAACLVTQLKESGQAAATVKVENVLKMYARLIADGGQPFWAAHSSILPQIATMTIGNQPVWTAPNAGLKEAPNGMLLGLPLVFVEQAETLGTKGDLQLINPSGYYAAVKRGEGLKFDSSIHLYFDYGVNAFRWMFRIGGQPFLSAAVSRAKGSETKSHFVALETRA